MIELISIERVDNEHSRSTLNFFTSLVLIIRSLFLTIGLRVDTIFWIFGRSSGSKFQHSKQIK